MTQMASRPSRSDEPAVWPPPGRVLSADTEPIVASVFSFPHGFVSARRAEDLLRRVREASIGERSLIVLTNGALLAQLQALAGELELVPLDSTAEGFSPWPRDAMTFLFTMDGRPHFLVRPNRQRGRAADSRMAPFLIDRLPSRMWERLGRPLWSTAPTPFHNGQILLADGAAWVSLHSLERRVLQLLGEPRIPLAALQTAAGLRRYLVAVSRAAAELGTALGRPIRFVHGLPGAGSSQGRVREILALGQGAGHDLDSLVTILPRAHALPAALVGSLEAGSDLLASQPPEAVAELARTFHLASGTRLVAEAVEAAGGVAGRGLEVFLDSIAKHLARLGLEVGRLPLALLPPPLGRGLTARFLLGWNNTVLEVLDRKRVAVGFASGLPAGDELATLAFRRFGYALELMPPLSESVIRNGGYRCASNHLRTLA